MAGLRVSDEVKQQVPDLVGSGQPVGCQAGLRPLRHQDAKAAPEQGAKGIFVSEIVADVDGKHVGAVESQLGDKPTHCASLVPLDRRSQLEDLLAPRLAQPWMVLDRTFRTTARLFRGIF
jgi:hypothetical protein